MRPLTTAFAIILCICLGMNTGKTQDITTGLVAHYNFETATGPVVDDAGNNDGSTSPTGVDRNATGKTGKAFNFDGLNGRVDIPGAPEMNPVNFTLAYWVKSDGAQGTYARISGFAGFDFEVAVGDAINRLKIYIGAWYDTGYDLSYNTWTHIATTYDGTTFRVYVDGQEIKNYLQSRTLYGNLYFAGNYMGNECFDGTIDDARLYNRALTSADVQELYNPGGTTGPALSVSDVTVNEADGNAAFSISLTNSISQNVTGNYSTSNGTATSGSDYYGKSGTFTIPAGYTSTIVNVTIIDDDIHEGTETFNLNISNPVNATINDATGVCTIIDNDIEGGLACPLTVNTYPFFESFETHPSTWENTATGDDIDWTRRSGGTPSGNTGPTSAHDGSYYYYTEATGYYNKTALLISSCYDLSGQSAAQFSFFYHMFGSAMGELKLEASTDGTNWNTLWSLSGDQGLEWKNATVNLDAYLGNTVQLRFRGKTGGSYTSDMAIDKLEFTANGCTGAVASVNALTGDVQLNLALSGNNLSVTGGNSILLPFGTGDITSVVAGEGVTGGGTSGEITIGAQNTAAIWNAGKIQSREVSNAEPLLGQVLKWNQSELKWAPADDETGVEYWQETGINDIYFEGNVGIGTSNAEEKLTVKGNIHTEEVIVNLDFPAPDYVFEEDYNLRSVFELEEFLKQNKHLPNMPPGSQLEKGGVNLAYVNMMLLKQIEELTLYIIDQEKRIRMLEEESWK